MVFARYFLTRFFSHVFAINIGLTLLFNLIEFFEKMVRAKQVSTETIIYFIALNSIPSFFENLPIAAWLGSCMSIREMQQQNEWEILRLLNIPIKKIFALIFIAGTILLLGSLLGKECLIHTITTKAEKFKQKKFKQSHHIKLLNQWFNINNKDSKNESYSIQKTPSTKNNTFCHFHYLNVKTKEGAHFSMLELLPSFKIKKITTAPTFSISPHTNEIIIPKGTTLFPLSKKKLNLKNKKIVLPSFFSQLAMHAGTPSLQKLFHVIIFDKNILPFHTYHHILYLFLNQILLYLLLIIYPLLTFALFLFRPSHYYQIFLSYPLATLLFTLTDSLQQTVTHGTLAIIPFLFLFVVIFFLYKTIRK